MLEVCTWYKVVTCLLMELQRAILLKAWVAMGTRFLDALHRLFDFSADQSFQCYETQSMCI